MEQNFAYFILSCWCLIGAITLLIATIYRIRLKKKYSKYSNKFNYENNLKFLQKIFYILFLTAGGLLTTSIIIKNYKDEVLPEIKEIRKNTTWYKLKEHGGWL